MSSIDVMSALSSQSQSERRREKIMYDQARLIEALLVQINFER
jgi:hypothetical protein